MAADRPVHRRIAKNAAALVLLRIARPLVSVVVVLAVSHLLGTSGLGRYTLALTWFYLFNELAPLGLYALLSREGARDRGRLEQLLANALPVCSIAALLLTAAMAGLARLLDYDAETQLVIGLAALGLLPSTLSNLFEASLVAVERMEHIAAATLAEILVRVGGAVAALSLGYGLAEVMLAGVIGHAAACLLFYALVGRAGVRVGWSWEAPVLRYLANTAPTFLLISIFATLYWRTDVFMLSKLARSRTSACTERRGGCSISR
jgi:O-antigen/teichoic acid export membrane protein